MDVYLFFGGGEVVETTSDKEGGMRKEERGMRKMGFYPFSFLPFFPFSLFPFYLS